MAAFRGLATSQGWLAPGAALPDDATLSAAIGQARPARSTISSVEPYRAQVEGWAAEGIGGMATHAALCRNHDYRGSYSAVRRMLAGVRASLPPEATVRRVFALAEAAQVDFGAGPLLFDPARGQMRRTWASVRTLCFFASSVCRVVFDQTVMTWLGCHRRAFDGFHRSPLLSTPSCALRRLCFTR